MTYRSKQTPKPSRALIAAQQKRDRPMMRRVMATPEALAINADRPGYSEIWGRQQACKCGYFVCAKRGPCAPAPQPIAAPAAEPARAPEAPAVGSFEHAAAIIRECDREAKERAR